ALVRFLRYFFFFSSRRRHTSFSRDWSSDVCSSDLFGGVADYVVARGDSTTTPGGLSGYTTVLVPDHPVTFWDAPTGGNQYTDLRSEERRVGKECRSR